MATYDISEIEYSVADARFGLVVARFNDAIVSPLLASAVETLEAHGVADERLTIVRVPGAFEIPLAARRLADHRAVDAIITLGAVVRGGTPHFEYVAGECARGVAQIALELDLPVIFGVLTTDDMAQATARAGGEHGNKGREAALAALEMVSLWRQLPATRRR